MRCSFFKLDSYADVIIGILWLHCSNPVFIHRDLKVRFSLRVICVLRHLQTSNLLVDSNMTVKVCDFGLSQIKPRGVNLRDGQEGAKGVCTTNLSNFAF